MEVKEDHKEDKLGFGDNDEGAEKVVRDLKPTRDLEMRWNRAHCSPFCGVGPGENGLLNPRRTTTWPAAPRMARRPVYCPLEARFFGSACSAHWSSV